MAKDFRSTSKEFASLLNSLFDADPFTLQYVKLLQQSCNLISNIIHAFTSPEKPLLSPVRSSSTSSAPVSLETNDNFDTNHTLGMVCNKLLTNSQANAQRLQSLPFSYEHLSTIEESILTLLDVPFLLPPSYFSSYQSTSVQLALSPSISSKPVTVVLGHHLALKVEGVVEHYGNRIYRSPASVVVNVKPQLEKLADLSSKAPGTLQELEETPAVKNDYYMAEFLLTLPAAGQYVLKIDNNLVDHEGKIWHTGPSVEMNVIVDVEEKLEQLSRAASTGNTSGGGGGGGGTSSTSATSNEESKTHKPSSQW